MAVGIRDLRIGRLLLPTIMDDQQEQIGSPLEAEVGVALGKRRVKGYTFKAPIHGTQGDTDQFAAGERMRRQVRAMLDNDLARANAFYLAVAPDSQLNGWIMVGAGTIIYQPGGPTLSEYELSLDEVFRVASLRTHRAGRRCELYDRRLSTTPRDYLGIVLSTDFAGLTALALNVLPVAVTDVVGTGGATVTLGQRTGIDGACSIAQGRAHGDVLSFEQAEADMLKGDVVVYDRQGNTAPGNASMANDLDPQANYGWEEIYGTDQALTIGDVPVMVNGLCRVRYDPTNTPGFRVDAFVAGTGYVEQGKVNIRRNGDTGGLCDTLVSAQVVEWTRERAVMLAVMRRAADSVSRELVYLTLQRGWTGPRIEVYPAAKAAGTPAGASIWFFAAATDSNDSAVKIDASGVGAIYATAGSGSASFGGGGDVGAASFTGENWLALLRSGTNMLTVVMATLQAGAGGDTDSESSPYGVTRNGIVVFTTTAGYTSAHLGFHAQQANQIMEAESMTLGTGTTSAADGNASGGNTAQASRTSDAIHVSKNPWLSPYGGKYRVFVRAKAAASQTLNVYVNVTGQTGATKTTTSTTYVWLDLGEVAPASGPFEIHAWGTGAGTFAIDRVETVKVEDRATATPTFDGGRDLGSSALLDSRSIPALVRR